MYYNYYLCNQSSKMKHFFYTFILSLAAFAVSSCDSHTDVDGDLLIGFNDNPTTGTTPTTKTLKKMVSTDSDGEVSTFNYNYSSGKLSSVSYVAPGISADYTLTYDGNNIIKMMVVSVESGETTTTNLDFTYNGSKLEKATGTMQIEGEEASQNETTFTYNAAGKISKIYTALKTEGVETLSYESDLVFTGSNITQWKHTITARNTGPITIPPIIFQATLSNYDIYRNPLATLPVNFTLASAHFMTETNSIAGLSLNNYKSITIATDLGNETYNYTYLYDSAGYPTSATSTEGQLTFTY